jgi:PKD repeat protein
MGVSVLLGNGDGTFQAPGWYSTVGYNPRGPAVGDFNEDGNLDVGVGTYQWPSGVSVLLGNVDGTFSGPTNYNVPDNLGNLVATDMDKDGHIDLVTANMSGSLSILLGNGDGTFNPARNVAAGQSPVDVAVADLDNDGVLEIAAADYGGNAAVVLKSGIECVPKASFSYGPSDASVFDTVQFYDESSDPGGGTIVSWSWTFGDGKTSTDQNPTHQFAKDGDYSVQLTVKTDDNRSGSITQTVQVRTHDISISKLAAPTSAHAGQTATLTVRLKNTHYPEDVYIELYRSTTSGFSWIDSKSVRIPVTPGSKTYDVSFTYTFTNDDAIAGKVSFQANASLQNYTDKLPNDNTAISSPTRITR